MAGNGNFKWWCAAFEDGEMWSGPFDTRAEAVAAGNAGEVGYERDHFFIGEADKSVATPTFNSEWVVERLVEDICEHNEECWGKDGYEDAWTAAEQKELERALEATVTAWMAKYPARTFSLGDWRVFEKVTRTTPATVA